uniref:Mannose-specific lectin 2 n=1 Tax=Crocus vernus TaxID=87752 RepID=LEC2_CROVR|nr:RecName: Full=Mannose-specific lectin 2; AltName: Full=Agglutinin; Short=CVA; AltName: Full=Mannose-binding lectin; Contains: RecName: Full=Mannose-specific lectin 2 chain 1; AltName: Full=CVA-DOM1; Contains: RecName: Full=Mannose-specific lectin 2 chain 2; AltName: Full=CVA-DOM2; Flags: Precursor [Crocus vernus]AAG10404.1 mannose-binding lectin [Crocus vernus]
MAKSLVLSSLLLALLLAAPLASLADNNVLLTGDVLHTDNQLSFESAAFVMQGDCNLVLYNEAGGFQSNTHGRGVGCTLTLNNLGQLEIHSANSNTPVWVSPRNINTVQGNYAAVLGPDQHVTIYGPAIWSTPAPNRHERRATVSDIPRVRNVLFSSQVMSDNAQLATRDYSLVMRDDCNLALTKGGQTNIVWESGTSGRGQHCFMRLGHTGLIEISDDRLNSVWRSNTVGQEGDYVLILQINGQAVVYGPAVWSTASSASAAL